MLTELKKGFTDKNRKAVLTVLILSLIMTCRFWIYADHSFQSDSQDLVMRVIYSVKNNGGVEGGYGLGWYKSQIGLQGFVFRFLTGLNIPHDIGLFKLMCCALLSAAVSLISFELNKKYGAIMAAAFYLVTLSSAWVMNFAPNLYWVAFTWFIPCYLGLVCLNNPDKRKRLYPLFFLAVFIKSSCGYEYITAVMLASVMFLAAEWIVLYKKDKEKRKIVLRAVLGIGIASLAGFFTAFIIHSLIRGGGNVTRGIQLIWNEDMVRRTFGDPDKFIERYSALRGASVPDVVKMYFSYDKSGRNALFFAVSIPLINLFNSLLAKKHRFFNQDFLLFAFALLTSLSWFVLGKNHSYVHPHMNYVMWYMGYMQISVYVTVKYIVNIKSEICPDILPTL